MPGEFEGLPIDGAAERGVGSWPGAPIDLSTAPQALRPVAILVMTLGRLRVLHAPRYFCAGAKPERPILASPDVGRRDVPGLGNGERYLQAVTEFPSNYRTGDDALDRELVALLETHVDPADREFVFELMVSALRLSRENVDRGGLKMVAAAVKEFRYSFGVFAPYEGIRKCTVFGSARTKAGDPAYACAHDFAEAIAARDWMVITGAGPGIMEAGHEGAGADKSFGVNIVLPFESDANPVIADDPKLINFKYFFTRKVMFVKESHGYVMLPGGFGTMDEAFELLTLVQTGKSYLAPIVLMDAPDSTYWDTWFDFIRDELLENGLISPADLELFTLTSSVDEAVDELCGFYDVYHSMRYVGRQLVLRLKRPISDHLLERLNDEFSDIVEKGRIERTDAHAVEIADHDHPELPRLMLRFDRRSHARLRTMVRTLNRSDI